MDRLRPTSGQLDQKLIVSKLATISDGLFAVNFWPSWPEVNGDLDGHRFRAGNFCPSWAEVETWTMMVTVFAYGTSAHEGRKLKCGPSWSTFFIPGTSDQVGPK